MVVKLENLMRYQHIELRQVFDLLYTKKSIVDKKDFLKGNYPSLYLYVMNKNKMHLELQKYRDTCEEFKIGGDATNYSFYVHGKFLPWI